jgi:fructan beta-fructosidase
MYQDWIKRPTITVKLVAVLCLAMVSLHANAALESSKDILIADFESETYGSWVATGTAFGTGPAKGTLPNQMPVTGFQGDRLVNSYYGGDDSVGTLTSPPFKVERKFLQFLVGGGGWEERTCMNLLANGMVVRTVTGANTAPGGTEALSPHQWDISDLMGQTVVLQIVDNAQGGWGHINIDHIVQTDQKLTAIQLGASRTITVTKRYINLPIKNGAAKQRMSVWVDGKKAREFDIELAEQNPDWWAFVDANCFHGKEVTIKANKLPEDSTALQLVDQSNEIKNQENLYHEARRPQFHFSSRRGWINDPNGLVFYKGEYHLFYQHNPYGWDWGNMHWGHAVSKDLVHWKELPTALYPDNHGTMFSGSAVVDWNNTAGFQSGKDPVLVAMFTAAGHPFTQCIAFSNDRGRNWTKYENNPVLDHIAGENRDPKVIWFAPQKKWVMALYLDKNDYALFSSPDLKHWQKLSDVHLSGDSECPEFFEIPVDGNQQNTRWVFYGASGVYLVGKFDGTNFTPETQPQRLQHGNAWYASQTYNDISKSDGRRILIPWARMTAGDVPFHQGMPFNQMMGLPVELRLITTEHGLSLVANPVAELHSLRSKSRSIKSCDLKGNENPLAGFDAELFEIEAGITIGSATEIVFSLRGIPVSYDVSKQELSCRGQKAGLKPVNGKISLHMLVDRTSVDVFGGGGRLYMPIGIALDPENRTSSISAKGEGARLDSVTLYKLKSAW